MRLQRTKEIPSRHVSQHEQLKQGLFRHVSQHEQLTNLKNISWLRRSPVAKDQRVPRRAYNPFATNQILKTVSPLAPKIPEGLTQIPRREGSEGASGRVGGCPE